MRRALTCLGDRPGLGGTEKALGPDQTEYQYGGMCLSLMFSYFGFLGAPLLVKISYFHVLLLAFPRTKFEWSWLMELKVGQSCYSGDEFKQTRANFLRVFCCGALEHWRPRSQVLVCFCVEMLHARQMEDAPQARRLQRGFHWMVADHDSHG